MPTSKKGLEEMLDGLAETLLVLVHEKYEVMPNDAKPEAIWKMLAEMTDGIIGACKRLVTMSECVSPDMILKDISRDTRDEAALAMNIIRGSQRSSRIGRSVIFDEESRNFPPPRKNMDSTCAVQTLHEMVFFDSDCFLSLSSIQPGYHGWIIIFRDELKDWLLSAVEPFHVLYEDTRGKRKYFGIYKARSLPRANMSGAEIACLKDNVGETIITALSRSERGSESYNSMREKLLLSLKTLPCIFLQCIEFLPVMYPNFLNDVQLAQQISARLTLPLPRITISVPIIRESQHSLSNLSAHPRTVPFPGCEPYQRTRSSQQVLRHTQNETNSSAQGTSASTARNYSSASYGTPDLWYNFGDPDSIMRGPRRAFAGYQTWNQDHQNINLANNSDRNLGPVRGTSTRLLRFSAHNNYQPRNPQSNFNLVSHDGMGTDSSNSEARSKLQSYSATYGTPRGYQVQNQNINPICNHPPIRTQFTRLSRGLYPQNEILDTRARLS